MKIAIETTRKYEGEEYLFTLKVPEYEGETGVLGVECEDIFYIDSPKNSFGYPDTYIYNPKDKKGHWSWRSHPVWITRKIKQTCDRLYKKYDVEIYMQGLKKRLSENGIKVRKSMTLKELEDLFYGLRV